MINKKGVEIATNLWFNLAVAALTILAVAGIILAIKYGFNVKSIMRVFGR